MDATQFYETAIYNREGGQAFRFVTVPTRALAQPEVPEADTLARNLGFGPIGGRPGNARTAPIDAWTLPLVIDAALGNFPIFAFREEAARGLPPRVEPSQFAQHLAYAPVVPVESSPLSAKSLADLVTASGSVGAAAGYAATGDLLVLIVVPAGIVVCGAARGVSDALRIGLRAKLLSWMGVDDPELTDTPGDDATEEES